MEPKEAKRRSRNRSSKGDLFLFFMSHFIYIIYSKTIDKHYVGYSKDPWVRVIQHNANSMDKYTGRAKDWILAAVFSVDDTRSNSNQFPGR